MLTLIFVSVIGISLARGRRPDCFCFGEFFSGPIGLSTLFRNMALLLCGILVLNWEMERIIWNRLGDWTDSLLVTSLSVLSLFLIVMLGVSYARYSTLSRQFDELVLPNRTIGLSVGENAPEVELMNLSGEKVK